MFYVNGDSVIVVSSVYSILSLAVVGARFALKFKKGGFGADDYLCVPALLMVLTTAALMIDGSKIHALGYHDPKWPPTEAEQAAADAKEIEVDHLETAMNLISPIVTSTIRVSICCFYRRIFRGKIFNVVNWSIIVAIVVWTIVFTIAHLFACGRHVDKVFMSYEALPGQCSNVVAFLLAMIVTNFILDVAVWSLPHFWVWRLKMPLSQKLTVSSIFLVGAFTIAAGAVRIVAQVGVLYYNVKSDKEQKILGLDIKHDTLGVISVIMFWQFIELGTGMVVCCLPSLWPLVRGLSTRRLLQTIREKISWYSVSSNQTGHQNESNRTQATEQDSEALRQGSNNSGLTCTDKEALKAKRIPITLSEVLLVRA